MDPAHTAVNTRVDKLPSVLDFAFARAVIDVVAGNAGTDELAKLFRADPLYEGGAAAALRLPTFIGNHDAGRFPHARCKIAAAGQRRRSAASATCSATRCC